MCKLKVKNLYGIYKLKVAVLEEVFRAYTFIQYIILIDYINGFFVLIHINIPKKYCYVVASLS